MVDGVYTFIFKTAGKKEIVKTKQTNKKSTKKTYKGLSELIETVENWRKVLTSMKALFLSGKPISH